MDGIASSGADRAPRVRRRPLTIVVVGAVESTHVRSRAEALARRGHRVIWLAPKAAGLNGVEDFVLTPFKKGPFWLRAAGFVTYRIGGWSLYPLQTFVRIEEALERLEPDLIHVHYAYSMLGWLIVAAARCPLVVSVMGGDILFEEQGSATPLGRWLTMALLKDADLITAKSNLLIEHLERLGGFGHKAMRLVWGVDPDLFRPQDPADVADLARALGLPDQARVILSPKILQPFYNIDLVIDAMAVLARRFPDAILLVTEYAAQADYKARLLDQVERLGLREKVRFAGHVPVEKMPLYYSLAEVAVAVPRSDGLPQALFEAMACEVPNVLGRLPRYLEVVADRESVVFVDFDAGSIAAGIASILEDRDLAGRIRKNGRAIVMREANLEKEVDAFEDRLYPLLDRPRAPKTIADRATLLAAASAYSASQGKGPRIELIRKIAEWLARRAVR